MPIIEDADGNVEYKLERQSSEPNHDVRGASNRQKKNLRFFKIPFTKNLTAGAAGWEIASIMMDDECRVRWRRYLFLTKDFDSESDSLKPFDAAALQAVQIPDGWSSSDALRQFQDELVDNILHDESPFDRPQPPVLFAKHTFVFTGKFAFGTRKACQDTVISHGGFAPDLKTISHQVDYLVIGTEGSNSWRRGTYGNKIEAAILLRRESGSPAIISEEHWAAALKQA